MIGPTFEQQRDFIQKVGPAIQPLYEDPRFKGAKFLNGGRFLNLIAGHSPKTKLEAAFAEEARRLIWKMYPNDRYPAMAEKPDLTRPSHLRAVS